MATAQLRTLLYWPRAEFMYLVLTTSTGEAITVVHNPAPKADAKWQGRLSVECTEPRAECYIIHMRDVAVKPLCFTCQLRGPKEHILDEVIGHQFCAVNNSVTCNVWSCACVTLKTKIHHKKWSSSLLKIRILEAWATFPQTTNAFLLGNRLVSIHCVTVAPGTAKTSRLCLEANFHHVCGLSNGNRQGTCGRSSQQPTPNAHI